MICEMAQRGQLKSKIDEPQLIALLEKVGAQETKQCTKIVSLRRKTGFGDDEDEDEDDDDW